MRHSSEWACTGWALFCRRITNPEIGTVFTFLTLRKKVLYFSQWHSEQKKHFFFLLFERNTSDYRLRTTKCLLEKECQKKWELFSHPRSPLAGFLNVQLEKTITKSKQKRDNMKKIQFIFTWNCDAALDLVMKKLPDSLFQ